MMTTGALPINASSENKIIQGVNWALWRQRAARGWKMSCEVVNGVLNVFFRPCPVQEQVDARLQEMKLRRYMNIL